METLEHFRKSSILALIKHAEWILTDDSTSEGQCFHQPNYLKLDCYSHKAVKLLVI